jgi:hypothetical protein
VNDDNASGGVHMNIAAKRLFSMRNWSRTGACLTLAIASTRLYPMQAQPSFAPTNSEKATMNKQTRFYCNTKALNPTERVQHKKLTDKLVANRKGIVETSNGYEFQFSPSVVSVEELAQWVRNESKCCPFFDFHIDLERQGSLLCLRLTGEEGIKPFIQAEFQVPSK